MLQKEKRIVIQLRVSAEQKNLFEKYCNDLGTSMSDELKRYITSCNKKIKDKQ